MRGRLFRVVFFSVSLYLVSAAGLRAQTVPSAYEGGVPVVVGGGISDFNMDWDNNGSASRMIGITAWADFYPKHLPVFLKGLGVEAEGRSLRMGRPSGLSKLSQDTGMVGLVYQWHHYRNFRPYGKALVGIGSIDFPGTTYTHDTRSVAEMGGGFDYRLHSNIWLRAGYDYQFWESMFGNTKIGRSGVKLHPNGFTIGATYDFRGFHRGK